MPISTDPATMNAFRAAYRAGQRMAEHVDAMRWQTRHYYYRFRRRFPVSSASQAEALKLGFAEGYEAGQNEKARYVGGTRPMMRLLPAPNAGVARN